MSTPIAPVSRMMPTSKVGTHEFHWELTRLPAFAPLVRKQPNLAPTSRSRRNRTREESRVRLVGGRMAVH